MHIVKLVLGIILLLVVLGFVLLNWLMVPLSFYFVTWELPLSVLVLLSFIVGVFVGIVLHAIRRWRKKTIS